MLNEKKIKIQLSIIMIFFSSVVSAVNFDITPLTTLPTTYNENESVDAFYKVTNTSNQTLTAYIKRIPPNTSQSMSDGSVSAICQNPFSLAPNTFCHLKLNISGPIDSNDINQHLWICLTNSTSTCNAPATQLNITETPISAVTIGTVTYPVSQDFLYTNISTSNVPDANSHLTLSATLSYLGGYTINATNVQWISDRPDLVTISNSGVVQAQKLPGVAHIKAKILTHLGYVESQSVVVRVKRKIVDIEIFGARNTMHPKADDNQTLQAYAIFADGTRQILINDNNLEWKSDTSYITIGQYNGSVTASCPSNTILPSERPITKITATYKPANIKNKTPYEIAFQSDVTNIDAITPSKKFIYKGSTVMLYAKGTTECNQTPKSMNLNDYVVWSSDNTNIATVQSSTAGQVTVINTGSATISASKDGIAPPLNSEITVINKPTHAIIGAQARNIDNGGTGGTTPVAIFNFHCNLDSDLKFTSCSDSGIKPTQSTRTELAGNKQYTTVVTKKMQLINNAMFTIYQYYYIVYRYTNNQYQGMSTYSHYFIDKCTTNNQTTYGNCTNYIKYQPATDGSGFTPEKITSIVENNSDYLYVLYTNDNNSNQNNLKRYSATSTPSTPVQESFPTGTFTSSNTTESQDIAILDNSIYIKVGSDIKRCSLKVDHTIDICTDSGLGINNITKPGRFAKILISPTKDTMYIVTTSAEGQFITRITACGFSNNNDGLLNSYSTCKEKIISSQQGKIVSGAGIDPAGQMLYLTTYVPGSDIGLISYCNILDYQNFETPICTQQPLTSELSNKDLSTALMY